MVVKKYKKRNNKYYLSQEGCFATLDTLYDRIIIQNFGLEANDIIVMQYYWVYIRFKIDSQIQKSTKDIVLEKNCLFDEVIFFNKFPLLKKRGKLIPCGMKEQLEECWLYNGFYFPTMKMTKNVHGFKEVELWKIGLLGLPYFEYIDGY